MTGGLLTKFEHQSWDGVTTAQAVRIKKPNGTWSSFTSSAITSMVAGFEGVGQAIKGPYNQYNFTVANSVFYTNGYLRMRVKFDDASVLYEIAKIWSGATGAHFDIHRTTARKLRVTSYNLVIHVSTAADIPDGVWTDIEFAWKCSNTNTATMDVKINGLPDPSLTMTGVNTTNNTWNRIYVGTFNSSGQNMTVDDVIIGVGNAGYNSDDFMCDTLGNPRTWLATVVGDGYLQERWKRSDNNALTPLSDLVDEIPGDSDTSYVYITNTDNGVSRKVFFELATVDPAVITVYALSTYVHGYSAQVSNSVFYQTLRISGNDFPYAGLLVDQNFTSYSTNGALWTQDPSTLSDWTPATVSGLELGIEVLGNCFGGSTVTKTSMVYIEVLYSGSPPPPDPDITNGQFLLGHTSHRLVKCFKIERTDGDIKRFTEFHSDLDLADGRTYSAAGGMEGAANRSEGGLKDGHTEYRGGVSDDTITHDDLHAGRYRDAKVTETVVDWRFPWVGPVEKRIYWITETTYDGVQWTAQLSTLPVWMRQKAGGQYNRTCRYKLFGPGCDLIPFVNANWFRLSVAVTSIASNGQFNASTAGFTASQLTDDWFNFGEVRWTTGANVNISSEVRDWVGGTGSIYLFIPTELDIQVGDTFEFYVGCNRTQTTCVIKFGNGLRFGGYKNLPGTDAIVRPAGT